MKAVFILLLFYFENRPSNPLSGSSLRLFSFYRNSTFQPPYQDTLNREMYQHFKSQIISSGHVEHESPATAAPGTSVSAQTVLRLSLFKMLLVQMLTFLWKVLTLNFIKGDYVLLVLESAILEYHIIEALIHFSLIAISLSFTFLLRRFVLKKRCSH